MQTSDAAGDSVRHFKQGRPLCFVIMSFRCQYDPWYEQIKAFIEHETGLVCERADRHHGAGLDLRAKVHEMILQSDVVIAEISEESPNVYYEYGYAMAHNRPPILTARKGFQHPTDLRGMEILEYQGEPKDDTIFLEGLKHVLWARLRTPVPELRKMMEPPSPFPTYILAAPRVPQVGSRHWWHPDETTTFGDNQGIRGLFAAFGSIFGTARLPELLHAEFVPDDFYTRDANFYLIGSSKVNPGTKYFLEAIQTQWQPTWDLVATDAEEDSTMVFRGPAQWAHEFARPVGKNPDGSVEDYGLLIRIPHPRHSERMVMIMMGRHSIGTGAACYAATFPALIRAIRDELHEEHVQLEMKALPFWALVCGRMNKAGEMPPESVRLVACGRYQHLPV